MKKHLILSLSLLSSLFLVAQMNETFEDGDFNQNPAWTGHQNQFIINANLQLQLNNEGNSDTSFLQTFNVIMDSVSWEFFIKLSFSPSSNNNARVYLVSDQEDLSGSLNGYFLQFGESLSDDAIELFRQNGTEITSICRGVEASIASSFNAKIRVIHRNNGDWMVYSDFNNTGQFGMECQGNDQYITSTSHFGFFCKYTSSNATNFYFDDIEIKYMEVDSEKPEVEYVIVENPNSLKLSFDEMVEESTALNSSNYLVNQMVGSPSALSLSENQTEVILGFENDFIIDQEYEISIENVQDISGNVMIPISKTFTRIDVSEYDIVINEIMADPTPVVQLPGAEYIELFNRTSAVIPLLGWKLEIGGHIKTFSNVFLAANSHTILCKESNITHFTAYGECIGFPTLSLTNSGQLIRLLSPSDIVIHEVAYSDEWYADPDKDDGGWSLEQINPSDFCSEVNNWKASMDIKGGTPGAQNSIFDESPVYPQVEKLELIDNPLLLLSYNQQMDLQDILRKSHYRVSPGDFQVQQVMALDTSSSVYLIFNEPFEIGVPYLLQVDGEIRNCVGQVMDVPVEIEFMVPKVAVPGDIVINEIMADPEPSYGLPLFEYLELYNNSNAPIDLSAWQLQTGATTRQIASLVLSPNSYVLLCDNDAEESMSEFGETYAFSSFSLANGGSQLVLRNLTGGIIHQVEYDDDWFDDIEKSDGGWSLEAIDPLEYCLEQPNWAESIDERGGSPGMVNSIDGLPGDIELLRIQRIELLSETSIRVYFSEKMDSISLAQAQNYEIDGNIGNPSQCHIEGPKYNTVVLIYEEAFSSAVIYTLEIQEGLFECNGSSAAGLSLSFAVPDPIIKGDIVFNEILFNAAIDDGEYVELVNISDKILETAGLSISRMKVNQYDTSWYTADLESGLLFPDDYVAYSPSPTQVLKVYYSEQPERIIPLTDLPDLPNSEAHILLHLTSSEDSIIDELQYNEDMHHSLLKDTKGVSLEKINLYAGNTRENWHSAATNVNYGTPAYQNSQYLENGATPSKFELSPEIFSPDNDGYEDVLQIHYKMEEMGYQLNLIIYDGRGRKIKHLVKNELLGTEGTFYWNGEDEDFQKADIGIYILLFKYFNLQGDVKSEKLTVVLGARL